MVVEQDKRPGEKEAPFEFTVARVGNELNLHPDARGQTNRRPKDVCHSWARCGGILRRCDLMGPRPLNQYKNLPTHISCLHARQARHGGTKVSQNSEGDYGILPAGEQACSAKMKTGQLGYFRRLKVGKVVG